MGGQLDVGSCFSGKISSVQIGSLIAEQYEAIERRYAFKIESTAEAFKQNFATLKKFIREKYPKGCFFKLGGSSGHFGYYDPAMNTVFTGGSVSYNNKISGVTLEMFFENQYNGAIGTNKQTLCLMNYTMGEVIDIIEITATQLGMTLERFL